MITENLSTLKINKLTREQYEAALEAGRINENEFYITEIEDGAIEEIQLNGTPISPASGVVNIDITEYVAENGGKIDSISVNGVAQTIDENKNIDITVPEPNLEAYATKEYVEELMQINVEAEV